MGSECISMNTTEIYSDPIILEIYSDPIILAFLLIGHELVPRNFSKHS